MAETFISFKGQENVFSYLGPYSHEEILEETDTFMLDSLKKYLNRSERYRDRREGVSIRREYEAEMHALKYNMTAFDHIESFGYAP